MVIKLLEVEESSKPREEEYDGSAVLVSPNGEMHLYVEQKKPVNRRKISLSCSPFNKILTKISICASFSHNNKWVNVALCIRADIYSAFANSCPLQTDTFRVPLIHSRHILLSSNKF